MRNKLIKYVVLGLVVLAASAAVMSSMIAWHQPKTPDCIA